MLKIALPDGSLEEGTIKLFKDSHLEITRKSRERRGSINDSRVSEVVFMRPQIIPKLVQKWDYDVGICGRDCVIESNASVEIIAELVYSKFTNTKARVVLFNSIDNPVNEISEISPGSRILSEYPNSTRRLFRNIGIKVEVHPSNGGTEAHIPQGYRYGVCISERGETLVANQQKVVKVLFDATTVLIANKNAMKNPQKAEAIHILEILLTSTREAQDQVLLMMNVPADKKDSVLKRLPALKRPTISKLVEGGFAINAVVPLEKVNLIIPELLKSGAEDILEISISKVVRRW